MNPRTIHYSSPVPKRFGLFKQCLRATVNELLEKQYKLEMNTAEKITDTYFRAGVLPGYYFSSNAPEDIADHVYIITQILNANTEFIKQESRDGKVLSYFINVGRDFPGKLIRILEENSTIEITAFDSVKTRSGIRIVTLEQCGREDFSRGQEEVAAREEILLKLRRTGHPWTECFLLSLPPNYLNEEIVSSIRVRPRINRHLEMFAGAMESDAVVVAVEETDDDDYRLDHGQREIRIGISVRNPESHFVMDVLKIIEKQGVNLYRSYLDTFTHADTKNRVVILSLYILREEYDFEGITQQIGRLSPKTSSPAVPEADGIEKKLIGLVRSLSAEGSTDGERSSPAILGGSRP